MSESMYVIWKLRCERAIAWCDDPTRVHSPHEIHNKWLQAINTRLRMDSVQTNKKIFKKKLLEAKIVLQTWKKYLRDDLHETRNWRGKTGVLVEGDHQAGTDNPGWTLGASPTQRQTRPARKGISSGGHIECSSTLTNDKAFELHQKKKTEHGPCTVVGTLRVTRTVSWDGWNV